MAPPSSIGVFEHFKDMPQVTGNELEALSSEFSQSVEKTLKCNQSRADLFTTLKELNPAFVEKTYSESPKANLLANIVSAVYAPLLHAYAHSILENIEAGSLSPYIIAPPRDAMPIVAAIKSQHKIGVEAGRYSQQITIMQPPINRITAGIKIAQNTHEPKLDPLLPELLQQTFQDIPPEIGYTEVETGIYGTTSLVTALLLAQQGINIKIVSTKFYALGPNHSFTHAILSNGHSWIAEKAEDQDLVSTKKIAHLMLLLDSMEEFGMEKFYKSIAALYKDPDGIVRPVLEKESAENVEIAKACQRAIKATAQLYTKEEAQKVTLRIFDNIETLALLSKEKQWPVTLTQPIPPMEKPEQLFADIVEADVFSQPDNLIL